MKVRVNGAVVVALMLLALLGASFYGAAADVAPASTDQLQARFRSGDCSQLPTPGEIRVLYRKYSDADTSGGCGFFRASRLEARWVIRSFDAWESHKPEVEYKTSGRYPLYVQRVIKGGCPPGAVNCQD